MGYYLAELTKVTFLCLIITAEKTKANTHAAEVTTNRIIVWPIGAGDPVVVGEFSVGEIVGLVEVVNGPLGDDVGIKAAEF